MNRKRRILSATNKLAVVQLHGKNVTQSEIVRLLDLNKSIATCFASYLSSQRMWFCRKPATHRTAAAVIA